MDQHKLPKDGYKTVLERVTTDAVHRRFNNSPQNKSLNKTSQEGDYYYCKQCSQKIKADSGKGDLKAHFKTVQHKPYSNCVYCTKPVYEYTYNKKQEVYHICCYD